MQHRCVAREVAVMKEVDKEFFAGAPQISQNLAQLFRTSRHGQSPRYTFRGRSFFHGAVEDCVEFYVEVPSQMGFGNYIEMKPNGFYANGKTYHVVVFKVRTLNDVQQIPVYSSIKTTHCRCGGVWEWWV